jgi:hypothetical protein
MYDRPMIRYNNPGDLNTWFVQPKEDKVPVWAVNVEDYDHENINDIEQLYQLPQALC